ncbi:metallophosphoesterase, partial [Motilibacter deserti]
MTSSLRRLPLGLAALVSAVLLAPAAPASAAVEDHVDLTVLASTDVHSNVFNWDYFANSAPATNQTGFAKLSTLVKQVRSQRGAASTLLVDNGDTIQGTPLGTYYAKNQPPTSTFTHPVAAVMNAMGYDAMVTGNHEFNYGIPLLRTFESQLRFPIVTANVLTHGTQEPAFAPYTIKTMTVPGHDPVKVGILGITTPGSAVWDRGNVEGRFDFTGGVEQAAKYVPQVRAAGADVVVVLAHTGVSGSTSYGDAIPFPENFAADMARQVPGIDVIVAGHSHSNVTQQLVANTATGKDVLLTQPGSWGRRLSQVSLGLDKVDGAWSLVTKSSTLLNTTGVAEDPEIVALAGAAHQKVVDYVN